MALRNLLTVGTLSATLALACRAASPEPEKTFWTRAALTGDWDGARTALANRGLVFTPTLQTEVFGNTGGADQGIICDGLLALRLGADLERLTGFWKGGLFHADLLYIYGQNLSARYVGDFSNTSNIAGPNSLRFQEIWFEQAFWNKHASLRLGMLAADTEFFISATSSVFLNGTFGAFTLIGSNFLNAPVYPVANPGVRLLIEPNSKFHIKAAVFAPDSGADSADNNDHGTHFHLNPSDGALVMGELEYRVNQSPGDKGLASSYKLGFFIQHGNYPTWQSQAEEALGIGELSPNGVNYAVYGVADQEIYKSGAKKVSAFVRGGFAPARYSFVDRYCDGGFNFTGFVPGRALDVAGIAVAYSRVSKAFSRAEQAKELPGSTSETVIEATYKVQIAPWWSVQPDLQYIFNPSRVEGSKDAFVIGVRATLAF